MLISRFNKIFVICAAYYKTGGTEVLHQLVYHINGLGGTAYIAYIKKNETQELCNPAFTQYVGEDRMIEAKDIEDDAGNAIIIPEGYPEYVKEYHHATQMLWWLSVDNFEGIYGFDDQEIDKVHEEFRSSISLHLVQSEYARQYLLKKNVPENKIAHLADYINDRYFLINHGNDESRENIVLYNPRKGKESTQNIIKNAPDINFVPIQNMTTDEVQNLMHRAKVYIDFGNHPGKDRIPREAAMSGLIVITGKHGSAGNSVDICIPDKYKIGEKEGTADDVTNAIRDSLANYNDELRDFDSYKRHIQGEKKEFISDIERIFFDFVAQESEYRDISPNGVLVVLVSYNEGHLTKECIKSIRQTVPSGCYKIAVADNCSTDGITEWLETQDDILFIKNDSNLGFGPACNQAVNMTMGTPYETYDIYLLNNDTRLAENSVYFLKKALYSREDLGAVGSISNYAGNRQQVDVTFDSVEEYLEYGRRNNVPTDNGIEERVRLSGFSMLIKRTAWDECGGFDEDFAPGYFEDDALSMELLKNGYRMAVASNSFVYHAGSQSFIKTDYNSLLKEHQELFIQKYGFDITEYAYGDATIAEKLHYGDDNEFFRLLDIGSGLGADIKLIRSNYSKCEAVGFEPNRRIYDISNHTETMYNSLDDLSLNSEKEFYDVLLIQEKTWDSLTEDNKALVEKMCKKNALIIHNKGTYDAFPYDKIKLVIWDLDDTLWNGTLSEGEVVIPERNKKLIRLLADMGIVNSISSKNDSEPVKERLIREGIWEYFVFNNINWDEKGTQIDEKLGTMGLRADNTLFVDDNIRNLEETKFLLPKINTAEPGIIPYLYQYFNRLEARDTSHSRLEQYKLLERKTKDRQKSPGVSKEQFLFESDIRISINRNCLEEIDRIHEMVMRTNQLNYTKNRDNKELLVRQITNDWNECAYIRVKDKYGDYGIVGFYCYNSREKCMEHFLFSCRVMGMGLEQYVYAYLGWPSFKVKEPVASKLISNENVPWIAEAYDDEIKEDNLKNKRVRLLLKGPCDMSAIEPYLAGANITTEFNYINEFGFVTTGQNHTAHIRESIALSDEDIDEIIKEAPFIIKGDFTTKLFSEKYHVICFSLLQDLSAGLYRNKKTGAYISFSSKNYDLTDPTFAEGFINKEIQGHDFSFTKEVIDDFRKSWEFVGNTPLEMLLDNLEFIYEYVPGKPLIILLLGSEVDYVRGAHDKESDTEEFSGLEEVYRAINPIIEEFALDHDRIKTINYTDFIHSQDDYGDCVNHFSRNVYYEIAGKICEYINKYV